MKLTIKLLAFPLGVLMLANVSNAESPREQFKQMVATVVFQHPVSHASAPAPAQDFPPVLRRGL